MSATVRGSSARCWSARWNTSWNSSRRRSTGCAQRDRIPPDRFVLWPGRMRRWMRTIAATVGWAIDPPTPPAVANNVNYTTERQQGLGYEPGRSKGAPVFRYWSEPAVSDLSDAGSERPMLSIAAVQDWAVGRQVEPGWRRRAQLDVWPRKNNCPDVPTDATIVLSPSESFLINVRVSVLVSVLERVRVLCTVSELPAPGGGGNFGLGGPNRSDFSRCTSWAIAPQRGPNQKMLNPESSWRGHAEAVDVRRVVAGSSMLEQRSGVHRWWHSDDDPHVQWQMARFRFKTLKKRFPPFALKNAGGLQRQWVSENAWSGPASARWSKMRIGPGRASIG